MVSRLIPFCAVFIICLTQMVHAASDTRGFRITAKTQSGQPLELYKRSYALLIGVSDYTAGWQDLPQIQSELDSVETVLNEQGFQVTRIRNPDHQQLKNAFEQFINEHGFDRNNRLLFFFSGHGYTRRDGEKGYLVPADASNPLSDEKGFLRYALEMNQVLAWARRIEAKHALFLFDSCFSGTIFKAKSLPTEPPHITALTERDVRQFITAGSAGEEVPAKSTFTPAFVDALRHSKGDLNKDGYVTGTELGLYLQAEVPKYDRQTPQYGRIRDYSLSQGDFVFVLPKSTPPSLLPIAQSATSLGFLQVNVNTPEARVEIDGNPIGKAAQGRPLNLTSGLPTGTVGLTVTAKGFQPEARRVEILSNEWTQVSFHLKPLAPAPVQQGGTSLAKAVTEQPSPKRAVSSESTEIDQSIDQVLAVLNGKSDAQRYNAIKDSLDALPKRLSMVQLLSIIETSAYRFNAIKLLKPRLPKPLSYDELIKIIDPVSGAERYNTITLFADRAPKSLSVDEMLWMIESSAYRFKLIKLLKRRLPKLLNYEELTKIINPVSGAERYNTITLLAGHAPKSLSVDEMLLIIESSAYRFKLIKLLKPRLPKLLSYEELTKIIDPVSGAERYNTITLLAGHAPKSLSVDEMLLIIESSAYRIKLIKLLKRRLPKLLSYEELTKIIDPVSGAERYNTITLLAGHAPKSLSVDEMLLIIESSAYRIKLIKLLKRRLPKLLSYEELTKIIDPVSGAERYNTLNIVAKLAPKGLTRLQVDELVGSSSYPDKARSLLHRSRR